MILAGIFRVELWTVRGIVERISFVALCVCGRCDWRKGDTSWLNVQAESNRNTRNRNGITLDHESVPYATCLSKSEGCEFYLLEGFQQAFFPSPESLSLSYEFSPTVNACIARQEKILCQSMSRGMMMSIVMRFRCRRVQRMIRTLSFSSVPVTQCLSRYILLS